MDPPRAGPRAHGPRCACVPVAGGGGVGVQRACSPEGRAAGDCCRRCQLPCYQLGIACALHGPRIRAGRGSALTPHVHDISSLAATQPLLCVFITALLGNTKALQRRQETINHFYFYFYGHILKKLCFNACLYTFARFSNLEIWKSFILIRLL